MKDRVIALAGLLQAIRLVQQMANNGQSETRPLAACIDSLDGASAGPRGLPGTSCLMAATYASRRVRVTSAGALSYQATAA